MYKKAKLIEIAKINSRQIDNNFAYLDEKIKERLKEVGFDMDKF